MANAFDVPSSIAEPITITLVASLGCSLLLFTSSCNVVCDSSHLTYSNRKIYNHVLISSSFTMMSSHVAVEFAWTIHRRDYHKIAWVCLPGVSSRTYTFMILWVGSHLTIVTSLIT